MAERIRLANTPPKLALAHMRGPKWRPCSEQVRREKMRTFCGEIEPGVSELALGQGCEDFEQDSCLVKYILSAASTHAFPRMFERQDLTFSSAPNPNPHPRISTLFRVYVKISYF